MATKDLGREPAAALRRRHRDALRIRVVEQRLAALYPAQEMRCPVHLSVGQELLAVGVCAALRPTDQVLGGHRSHGHYLAKGGDLDAMLAELHGKATGCCGGRGGSMHLIDLAAGFVGCVPIVGSTIPIAVGVAMRGWMLGERDRVVVAFFGDGATEEGVFAESLNFAQLHRLPVVFVVENNLYSVYTHLAARQPAGRDVAQVARAHGVFAASGDGNDVVETERLAREAVEHARSGQGPSLLVLTTYRWLEHCGPFDDDGLGYRPPGELARMKAQDGLDRLEAALLAEGALTPADLAALRAELGAEVDASVERARAAPWPTLERLQADTWAPGWPLGEAAP